MEALTELRAVPSMAGVVEVRLRHVDAEKGVTLGWFPVSYLERLLAEILRWGLYDEDGTSYSNGSDTNISGSFWAADGDAFFEFVLNPSGAE